MAGRFDTETEILNKLRSEAPMLSEAERIELAYVLVKNLDASIVRAPPSLLIERNSGG